MYIRTSFGTLILVILTGFAIASIILSSQKDAYADDSAYYVGASGYTRTLINIGNTVIVAEIADTEEKRERGLTTHRTLSPDAGMLFIFPEENTYGIWMKDMLFPIDIIWVSEKKRVVDIETNVSPETYPDIFRPSIPARYAIEVPAGFVTRHNISINNTVRW